MKATICELHDDEAGFERDWEGLVAHVRTERSEVVLLPEMPFAPWFAVSPAFDRAVWDRAVDLHERWLARLGELAPAVVLGSRPVTREGRRQNEAFVWDAALGYRAAHVKRYLPDEDGVWEAHWYERGEAGFVPAEIRGARVGFLVCTELWSMADARQYGRAGVQVLATPRATGRTTVEKWLTGGRAAAIVSGSFSISSNRTARPDGPDFGGGGWAADPDGRVLALTGRDEPFRTLDLDLSAADEAKRTYPRYALD